MVGDGSAAEDEENGEEYVDPPQAMGEVLSQLPPGTINPNSNPRPSAVEDLIETASQLLSKGEVVGDETNASLEAMASVRSCSWGRRPSLPFIPLLVERSSREHARGLSSIGYQYDQARGGRRTLS